MKKAQRWIELAGITPELRLVIGDVLELPSLVEKHDLAILWGHTMPHFDPFQAVKLFSGVASVLREEGVFFVEETDRIKRFLYGSAYRDFLVEQKTHNYAVVSLHEGYDIKRGMEERSYYKVPGFEKIAEMGLRPWDLASQLALGRIFFEEAELITPAEHGVVGVSEVLVFRRPRRIAHELYSQF